MVGDVDGRCISVYKLARSHYKLPDTANLLKKVGIGRVTEELFKPKTISLLDAARMKSGVYRGR